MARKPTNRELFQKEVRRIHRAAKKIQKEEMLFVPNVSFKMPNRVTLKDIERLKKITPKTLRKSSYILDTETGELLGIYGLETKRVLPEVDEESLEYRNAIKRVEEIARGAVNENLAQYLLNAMYEQIEADGEEDVGSRIKEYNAEYDFSIACFVSESETVRFSAERYLEAIYGLDGVPPEASREVLELLYTDYHTQQYYKDKEGHARKKARFDSEG